MSELTNLNFTAFKELLFLIGLLISMFAFFWFIMERQNAKLRKRFPKKYIPKAYTQTHKN